MLKKLKDYRFVIIYFAISFIGIFLAYKYGYIKIISDFGRGDHFNIITINSILGGFLFTGLGIIISGLDKEKIKRLHIGGYLNKYYLQIYLTIVTNLISMIGSILIILDSKLEAEILNYIEQVFLVLSIILFIKCMWDLIGVIRRIKSSG